MLLYPVRHRCVAAIRFFLFSLTIASRVFAASLDGALSPMVGPGYVLLAKQFNVSVDDVTSSFGFILLGLGIFM